MGRCDPRRRALALLSLGLLVVASSCIGGEDDLAPLSRSISGQWQVVNVVTYPSEDIDAALADARAPRMRHRLIRFSDAEIAVEGARPLACASPRTSRRSLQASELFAQSFRGETAMVVPFFENDEVVDALYLHCGGKPLRLDLDGDGSPRDVWMFLKPEQAYLRWYDGTVLWLDRVKESAPPEASFDCAKAQSPTEKAICGSRSLASYDRSVAEAYASWSSQYGADDPEARREQQRVVANQRAWIKERNACGAEAGCLEKSMRARIDALIAEVEKGLSPPPED